MRVVFAPEVEEDLYGLIKILVEKEYLGTYPFAISYVEELIADIQQNIHSKFKKKAPAFFERYGKDMYYITYQRNSNRYFSHRMLPPRERLRRFCGME